MRIAVLALVLLAAGAALADSPLSSSNLSVGYLDVPEVAAAHAHAAWPVPEAEALLLSDRPFDEKLAVLDALAFGHTDVPERYLAALARRKGIPLDDLALKNLTPEEKAVFGYALAMADIWTLKAFGVGNDLKSASPRKLLDAAHAARPGDFAIALADTIVVAQGMMQGDWCRIYKAGKALLAKYPEDKRNVRAASVAAAMEYFALYRESCPDERLPPEEHPDADEVNAMTTFGAHRELLLVATQGGAFVLDAATLAKRAFFAEAMCFYAEPVDTRALLSCSTGIFVVDGTRLTRVWTLERPQEGGLRLYASPTGPLTRDGRSWRRFNGTAFVKAQAPTRFDPYDLLTRKNHELWGLDFLHAITVGSRTLPVHSPSGGYPGRDPRSFVLDPDDRVWVIDFEDGFFRFHDEDQTFERVPVAEHSDGSRLVFDAAHRRVVFVLYREGPIAVTEGGAPITLGRGSVDMLRAAVVLEDGTLLLGGTPGLLRYGPDALVHGGDPEQHSLRRRPSP